MPLLPLQSPSRVPDNVPCAPAIVMSLKSTSDNVATAAAVTVICVPVIAEANLMRLTAVLLDPNVRVPLTVILPSELILFIPSDDLEVTEKLLVVKEADDIGIEVIAVFVNCTSYRVRAKTEDVEICGSAPVKVTVDVPAFRV